MRRLFGFAVLCAVATPAHADNSWVTQPVQAGEESIRYVKGVPTVELIRNDGIVRVTPLPMERGRLAFTVAVYNNGMDPNNFGIENIAPQFGARTVPVLSKNQLVKMAKNRAFWAQFGLAMLGATSASLAASSTNTYSSTWVTPRGTYSSIFTTPNVVGQIQAASIVDSTAYGIGLIQMQLDRTILALGDEIVQTTTVDPGESYAGRIIIDKVKPKAFPAPLTITLNWNGETYPLTFQIAKEGTPAPVFTKLTRGGPPPFAPKALERALASGPAAAGMAVPANAALVPTAVSPANRPATRPSQDFGSSRIKCETC